jgi:MFS family permease
MTDELRDYSSTQVSGPGFRGRRMVAVAFLAQNCAIGMNFGIYGTLVEALEKEFSASRALAASGLSMMTLVMGLLSPCVGSLIRRTSLRTLMIAGASLCAAGYIVLCFITSIRALLAVYALLIGPGVTFLGVIPASTLAGNWFKDGRGRALGIVNMPFFVFVFPFVSAAVLSQYGLRAVFIIVGVIFASLIPVLITVVDRPEAIGQLPFERSSGTESRRGHASGRPALSTREILGNRSFRLVTIGISLLTAGGIMMVTHMVPLALDRGVSLTSASLLLAIFGGSGAIGSLIFGWLVDRIGPRLSFVVLAFGWILPWSALIFVGGNMLALVPVAAVIGTFSGGIVALFGASMGLWLGRESMGPAMGLCYLLQVPFMFGPAPLAGYMVEVTGGYGATILLHISAFALVGVLFLIYRPKPVPDQSNLAECQPAAAMLRS